MTNTGSASFDAEGWVPKLSRYADGLITCLEANLWALSGTGIPLKAECRAPLTIERYRPPEKEIDDRRPVPESPHPSSDQHTQLDEALPDLAFFQKWLEQPDESSRPLALIAPFGCGKSVTLAMFTLTLAKKLKAWCDLDAVQRQSEPLPWVPFPVRLRAWPGDLSLWDYMVGQAQKDIQPRIRPEARLLESTLLDLVDARHLLPLFDGFDELAEEPGAHIHSRQTAIESVLEFGHSRCRYVISSRPGHGLETGGYAAHATFYTLQELDETAAEQFIVRSIPILASQPDHPILRRYRDAQPAINELFRRPLFLAAWCDKAKPLAGDNANLVPDLPTTVSGLMDVVLEKMLRDDRVLQSKSPDDLDYRALRNEALADPYRLGVVLTIHADVGFGRLVSELEKEKAIRDGLHPHAIAEDVAEYKKYERFALHTGLLLGHHGQTYVQKIPVVEYLIGYYYAWLAGEKPAEPKSAQQQLVRSFQRRLWWRDHDEVWLYAFDLLWHGSSSQQALAEALVCWLLNLSQACMGSMDWVATLPKGQVAADREPFTCHSFALRVLLPASHAADSTPAAQALIDLAMQLLEADAIVHCQKLKRDLPNLEPVARRHPKRIVGWLLKCLAEEGFREEREYIGKSIKDVAQYVDPDSFGKLLRYLVDPQCTDIQYRIVYAIGKAAMYLGPDEVRRLLECLENPDYKHAWDSIADAIGETATHLGPDEVRRLLECLENPDYKHAWYPIASAIGKTATHLGPDEVRRLLECLKNPEYEDEWYRIASAIGKAAMYLGPDEVRRLLECLKNPEYEDEWYQIASAIGKAAMYLGPDEVRRLLEYLKNPDYKHAWSWIASAISCAATHLEPDEVRRLLECLKNPDYQTAWDAIQNAIRQVFLSQATREWLFNQAREAAQEGRISYAMRIVDIYPGLIGFVRDVHPEAKPGRQIIYGVAERHDADLCLNADKRFAPELIREILRPKAPLIETIRASAIGDDLGPPGVVLAIKFLLYSKLPPSQFSEFDQAVVDDKQRNAAIKTSFEILKQHLTPEEADVLMWRGSRSKKGQAHRKARDTTNESGQHFMNWTQFQSLLLSENQAERSRRIAVDIYETVLKKPRTNTQQSIPRTKAFICKECTCIREIDGPNLEKADRQLHRMYPECEACEELNSRPSVPHPVEFLECSACKGKNGKPLRFTINDDGSSSPNGTPLDERVCPREECGLPLRPALS
ncbi:MAG: hypothetical protein QM754_07990 [Tepidisphaeraceae bacterium]